VSRTRLILAAVLAVALWFALQGGEYSTLEWLSLRREEARERRLIADLARAVDSLRGEARRVASDPETQERLARERHGMLKPGEHAFILEEADAER
jgi:cell division protein FtsB